MDQRELYNVRDLPQGEGVGAQILLRALGESDQMGIHILGREVRSLRLRVHQALCS